MEGAVDIKKSLSSVFLMVDLTMLQIQFLTACTALALGIFVILKRDQLKLITSALFLALGLLIGLGAAGTKYAVRLRGALAIELGLMMGLTSINLRIGIRGLYLIAALGALANDQITKSIEYDNGVNPSGGLVSTFMNQTALHQVSALAVILAVGAAVIIFVYEEDRN